MAQDPKKPAEKPPEKTEQISPEEMTYPTPELDPTTGAPVDTRFQSDQSQEATAQQSPKSEAKAQEKENGDDEEDDDDDDETSKGKGKSRGRR